MKNLILIAVVFLFAGCHSIQYGDAKVVSFLQKTTIKKLSIDPKTGELRLEGYNNNQVDGMVELFKAGVEMGKKSVVPVP